MFCCVPVLCLNSFPLLPCCRHVWFLLGGALAQGCSTIVGDTTWEGPTDNCTPQLTGTALMLRDWHQLFLTIGLLCLIQS